MAAGELRGERRKRARIKLIKRKGMKCFWCNDRLHPPGPYPNSMTLDHYIPRSRGGTNMLSNLVLCCPPCNRGKGNMLPDELAKYLRDRGLKYPKDIINGPQKD